MTISYFIIQYRIFIFTSGYFKPFIIRQSVSINVIRHHHYTRFGTTVEHISLNIDIPLVFHVDNRRFKTNCHISAISTQADKASVAHHVQCLCAHSFLIVTLLPFWKSINKLAGSSDKFINFIHLRINRTGRHNTGKQSQEKEIHSHNSVSLYLYFPLKAKLFGICPAVCCHNFTPFLSKQ